MNASRRSILGWGLRAAGLCLVARALPGCLVSGPVACFETSTESTACVDLGMMENPIAWGVAGASETAETMLERLKQTGQFSITAGDLVSCKAIQVNADGSVEKVNYATTPGDRAAPLLPEGAFIVFCKDLRFVERKQVSEGTTFDEAFPLYTIGEGDYGVVVMRNGHVIDLGSGGEFSSSFQAEAGDEFILVASQDLKDQDLAAA